MRFPSIYTAPGERPKFDFLLTGNYLSEYASEVDKARVRQNLGIPDEFTLYWGNIRGNIANQTDLIELINQVRQGITNNISTLQTNVSALTANLNRVSDTTSTLSESLQFLGPTLEELRNYRDEISEMKADIAQNAQAINFLGGSSDVINTIPARLAELSNQCSELSATVSANTAKVNVTASTLAAVQTQTSVNTTNITALQSQIARLSDITSLTGLAAQVEANTSGVALLNTRFSNMEASMTALRDTVSTHYQDMYTIRNQMQTINDNIQSINNTVSTHVTTIAGIQNVLSQNDLTVMSGKITANQASIAALQQQVANIPNVSNLISRIAALESRIGEVVITDLSCSSQYINTTTAGENVAVVITATYSSGTSSNVTTSVSASSSNSSVAYFNNGYVVIAGAGTATITYSYQGMTATTQVIITEAAQITPSYIGFAMTSEEVVLSNACKINSNIIGGTYTPPEVTEGPYYLWIVTPLVLRSFLENNMWTHEVPGPNISLSYAEFNGVTYNVYKFHGDGLFGQPDTLNSPTTITISTN